MANSEDKKDETSETPEEESEESLEESSAPEDEETSESEEEAGASSEDHGDVDEDEEDDADASDEDDGADTSDEDDDADTSDEDDGADTSDEDEEPELEEKSDEEPALVAKEGRTLDDATIDEVLTRVRDEHPDLEGSRFDELRDELEGLTTTHALTVLTDAALVAAKTGAELDDALDATTTYEKSQPGVAAFFDHPDALMAAARKARVSDYEQFDAFSPFPIHGMDEAMGLERSWMPWVTFGAGSLGFLLANAMQFGMMTFDWPMIIGGKPYAPWPAFVPIMFELTVLIGGVTTGVVMLKTAGCFSPADIIDPDITNDRFALWISAKDERYDEQEVRDFVRTLDPVEVRTFSETS